jgi:DNA-binding MarR family transcriptional regulator
MAKSKADGKDMAILVKDAERWARLADLVLIIAREIQFRGYSDERAVPLTASEGMVMRHLQSSPAAAPNQIAAAVGLQRTNLSTVLRGLESKGLIERRSSSDDRRGVMVRLTERGAKNYMRARREWGDAVSRAAAYDTSNLDAALHLLDEIEVGLIEMRPRQPGRNMARAAD